ncbi:MAG: pilin [Patescibacteria group bacterium]|nr:pilin [Patescibacteria group bacterium]
MFKKFNQVFYLPLIVVTVIFGCFSYISSVSAQAIEDKCVPKAEALNDCGVASPDKNISYICMGVMEDAKCKDLGGTGVDGTAGKYPGCQSIEGCCEAKICADSSTGAADTGTKPVPQTGSTANWDYNTGGTGIRLVACTKTGDCSIKDIVQQGIYVADFLIGISGAIFLIAFIWGGAMYLLSFGRSEWVTKGRNAMVKSMIGIVFIILAWTIVTFVAESLGYKGL